MEMPEWISTLCHMDGVYPHLLGPITDAPARIRRFLRAVMDAGATCDICVLRQMRARSCEHLLRAVIDSHGGVAFDPPAGWAMVRRSSDHVEWRLGESGARVQLQLVASAARARGVAPTDVFV